MLTRDVRTSRGGNTLAVVIGAALAAGAGNAAAGDGSDGGASGTITGCGSLSSTQTQVTREIWDVSEDMGIPERGRVVAYATAIQESTLRNLDHGDRDSLGVFQQRPSQGWGTPSEVTDPEYATRAFYQVLTDVDGWQTMPVTDAAQEVQRSCCPDAYADHTDAAEAIVDAAGCT